MEYNFYNVLGISPTASLKEVKGAYKRLALKHHPDKNPGDARAEELFKLVNSAYQTLSNPSKRARYDMRLQFQRQQQQRVVVQHQQQYYDPHNARTRPPAGVSERYYRNIKRDDNRFSRKDWYITFGFVAGLLFFSLLLKVVMDHITGEDKYETALTYIEDGKYSSAHRLLTDAIQFMPEHAAAYEARAKIELNVFDNYSSALRDLNKVIALREQPSALVYYMRGRSYKQLKQYQQAEEDLTRAIALNDTLWGAYLSRGEVRLFYLKKYEPAITDLTTYLENNSSGDSGAVQALTFRGFGHYKLGNYELSEQDYRRAMAMDKESGRLYYLLGRTELEQKSDSACVHFYQSYQLGYSAALLELRDNCQNYIY